jgi:site-specific DNA-cytosine methylase
MEKKKKVLELFAGSRCIGKAAESLGYEVFSIDWKSYEGINLTIDIEDLRPEHIPFVPDIIWLSPDCATYSIAGIRFHRVNTTTPISEYAVKCDRVNANALNIVKFYMEKNPNLKFYMENPRGMMRKMPFVKGLQRVTVWYCAYGDDRAKPTDIWSNNIRSIFNPYGWQPRPECFNGNKHCQHEASPRGSNTTGTQGKKNAYNRSKIPTELCLEILTENNLI